MNEKQKTSKSDTRNVKRISKSNNNNNNNNNNIKSVKIIPLGGLEKIGMNITAFECDNSIIVVDCGISFQRTICLVLIVIPDVTI